MTTPPHEYPPHEPTPPGEPIYGPPPDPPYGPPPAPKKNNNPVIITAIVVGAVLVLCLGSLGFGFLASLVDSAGPGSSGRKVAETEATSAATTTTEAPEPTWSYYQPTADDFELTVKILEKQCFGSAGCNVTFRIELAYGGGELDPSTTYEVTYEVRGGEDPLINTLTVTGEQYETDSEEHIQTSSKNRKLKAVVTDVSAY